MQINATAILREHAKLEALAASAVMTDFEAECHSEAHSKAEGAALVLGCNVVDIIAAGIDFALAASAAGVYPGDYIPEDGFAERRIAAYSGLKFAA